MQGFQAETQSRLNQIKRPSVLSTALPVAIDAAESYWEFSDQGRRSLLIPGVLLSPHRSATHFKGPRRGHGGGFFLSSYQQSQEIP
jgi:hypothetical protein